MRVVQYKKYQVKVGQVEVTALVCDRVKGKDISDQQLFELWSTFHRKLTIVRTVGGGLQIYSFNDEYERQLVALLPFLQGFNQQRLVVEKKDKDSFLQLEGKV